MLAGSALGLGDGQVEAEEVDVGIGLRLVQRAADLVTRRVELLGGRELNQRPGLGQVDLAVLHRPDGALRVDHRVGVLLQQVAADDQDSLPAGLAGRRPVVVLAQRRGQRPLVQRGDVVELLLERVGAQAIAVDVAVDVPELAEVAAALVGRVLRPEQLARELVIQPDHVGLDEALVGLDERDAVWRDQVDVRQEQLDGDVLERPVHRQVDLGIGHHLGEGIAGQLAYPGRHGDRAHAPPGYGHGRVDGGDAGRRGGGERQPGRGRPLARFPVGLEQLVGVTQCSLEAQRGRAVGATGSRAEGPAWFGQREARVLRQGGDRGRRLVVLGQAVLAFRCGPPVPSGPGSRRPARRWPPAG